MFIELALALPDFANENQVLVGWLEEDWLYALPGSLRSGRWSITKLATATPVVTMVQAY